MAMPCPGGEIFRFGAFEFASATGELRKNGLRLKLQDQPVRILILLLENAGEVVTREQIQKRLWADGVHVDYENAINSAVRKLREVLIDTSENPRFVETLPRRGYRFLAPVTRFGSAAPVAETVPMETPVAPVIARSQAPLIAATAIVATGMAAFWFHGHTQPELTLKAVPFTSYPGYESSPSLSPDGNQVAFSWNGDKGDNYDIYVKLFGSDQPLRLTTDPAQDLTPSWSPDGRSIAFVREEPADGNGTIMTVPALGGGEREVAKTGRRGVAVEGWSPDGRWLLVSMKADGLFLVSTENGEKRRMTSCQQCDGGPGDIYAGISPDARSLAFFSRRTLSTGNVAIGDIYTLPLTPDLRPAGEPARLTWDNAYVGGIAWTADSRELVFSSGRGDSPGLWRIAVSGSGKPSRLAFGENASSLAVSGRAKRLLYEQRIPADTNIWRLDLSSPTTQPTLLIASTRLDFCPRYSPDGSRIAFNSNRSGTSEIWVSGADGASPAQLTERGNSGSPSWSPDGRQIAFDSQDRGHWQIFAVGAHGGRSRQLTFESTHESIRPAWSHDGKWIYFASSKTGRYEVWKAPAGGGTAFQPGRHSIMLFPGISANSRIPECVHTGPSVHLLNPVATRSTAASGATS
jgi:Tol biopolymer transport system component/DNA-binding winged helix-turn-helix (wHTH) protein